MVLSSMILLQNGHKGMDMHNNSKMVKNKKGDFKTEVYALEAERIIYSHDSKDVSTTRDQLLKPRSFIV